MKRPYLSLAPRGRAERTGLPGRVRLRSRPTHLLRRAAAWSLALFVLGAVFASYFDPTLMFTLATQVWSCF